MKKIFLFLAILIAGHSFAQDTAISFIEVVQVEGATKDELYQRGRNWFMQTFKDSKEVLEVSDKEAGELSGKGYLAGYYQVKMMGKYNYKAFYHFTIRVQVKDGRYRYIISDISHEYDIYNGNRTTANSFGLLTSSQVSPRKIPMVSEKKASEIYKDVKTAAEAETMLLIVSLKKAMVTGQKLDDF